MNAWAFKLRPIADLIRRRTPTRLGWGALASIPGLALAGPTGESVVAGAAAISRPSATQTQIDQSSARAVVNWSTFSVDSDEYVVFNQPGATASILNRVLGANRSEIFGQIEANGRVFLVNPQGVYFAPGAEVDVAGLTASVMDITDNNFMSGNYVFSRAAGTPDGATVDNAGNINVSDGGFVVLAGDYANNSGVISARLGSVVLAAGSQMTLDLSDDGLVSFAVDEATVSSLAGANNTGQVLADGGQIIMTAKVANDLVATAVNNDGLLQAHRIVDDGGEIYLSAAGADIVQAGMIDVAGEGNQSGGEVGITGDADITLTANSVINANGSGAGNGGTVNVIADGMMAFRRDAEITALAGAEGERGGSVELSGYEGIQVRGNMKLGQGGNLLIDPAVVQLVDTSASYGGSYGSTIEVGFVQDQLNSGVNFTLSASSVISASTMVNAINATSPTGTMGVGDLALLITDNIGDIELAGVEINVLGDFSANAGSTMGDVNLGKVTAGNVSIFAGSASGNIALNTGGIAAASTMLRLSAADDIDIGTMALPGGLSLIGDDVNVDIDAGGNINVRGDLFASATTGTADVNVDAGIDITMGNVTVNAVDDADISIDATGDVVLNDITAIASGMVGSASIDIDGNDITVNNVTARASSDSVFVDFFANNNLTVNGVTTAVARDELSISYSASNIVMINDTINATANDTSYASVEIDGDNGVTTKDINAIASNSGSAYVDIRSLNGNVTINGTITARTSGDSPDEASIDIQAGGNITVGTAAAPGGLIARGSDATIDLTANGNVTVHGTIDASGTNGRGTLDVFASNDINIDNVLVYGTSDADVDLSAGRDIITQNVEAEIGLSGSYGGNATVGFFSERDVNAGNLEAVAGENGGNALVQVQADRKLAVKNVDAEAFGSGTGSTAGNARISLDAVTGIDAMNLAAHANAGTASIDAETTGGNANFLGLEAVSQANTAGIDIEGNVASTTINIGGDVHVSGTSANFNASAFNINLNGDFDLAAPSYVMMQAVALNNLVVNGDIVANEAMGGFLDVRLFGAANATINGDINLTAGTGSYAHLDIGASEDTMSLPTNTVNVNGDITVMSGMLANALVYGRNVNIPGAVTIKGAGMTMSGDVAAGFDVRAVNNLAVTGNVMVQNMLGDAGALYVFGGSAVVGQQLLMGGSSGIGAGLFNTAGALAGAIDLPSMFPTGKSVLFTKRFEAKGGQGSFVGVDVLNSITTGAAGIVAAKYGDFTTRTNATGTINLKSQIMSATFQNLGQTPNVTFDNRAFIGPSSINFANGTVLKAANFLSTGPLTFNGAFQANNLAVGVTNGTVTFNSPVNITGTTPFLPTAPDIALFNLMGQRGLLPPLHGPNVQVFAQNGINITKTFNVGGPSPFTKMFTNGPFNISGLTTNADNMLAVFSPIDTTRPIFFEDEPFLQPLGASGFFNFPTISGLPDNSNVTVVFGERGPALPLLNGPLTIGSQGIVDLGDRNMFIITRGAVTGADAVITNGIFEIIGLAQNNFFEVPIVNEFGEDVTNEDNNEDDEDDDDDNVALGGDGDDNGDDGGVAEEGTSSESMECSA